MKIKLTIGWILGLFIIAAGCASVFAEVQVTTCNADNVTYNRAVLSGIKSVGEGASSGFVLQAQRHNG